MAETTTDDTLPSTVIVIATEETAAKLRTSVDWSKVLTDFLVELPGRVLFPFTLMTRDIYKLFTQNEAKPIPLPWPQFTPGVAAQRFSFDMGHPQDGTAYIQNPANPTHYLLPALANERFVQEKVAAFVEIAEALGAKHLTLKSGSVNGREGKAEASLETAAGQAGLGVSFGENHSVDRQVLMEFAERSEGPHMPEQLNGWLVQDPILRSFVTTRLRRQRLMKAAVSLKLSESVELAAHLTTALPKMGIKTGGQYRHVQETTWAFDVEFWPGQRPGGE